MTFQLGNKLGGRFQPGQSANPAGRPAGINHWVRRYHARHYSRNQLQAIIASPDPAIPANAREAAHAGIAWLLRTGRASM